ncbi:hypothetical protein KI387_012432 [Taxus chinensis]|uniref:NADPH:adrenodoxin oxidoreductase, mitochondrial n=1 Tax=Taxus chinensis TaxID=29808 RepID=A0AA38FCB1_TAXCH|nr:hypothetical protein KI387_012432 [Taxus chinensis]
MLKRHQQVNVDIIERLPTPFGLVRSGVAPDHPETKVVINQFSRVGTNERCSFFGNVFLGKDISLSELRKLYHVVVLAYGAESDRELGIPGENLDGILSAREFVWWYNGHPDCTNLSVDLQSTDTAVVIGQGNVALDVARILLRPLKDLATTDIAEHALSDLQKSCIRKVYLVGRRGPVQTACTAKELREILGIPGVNLHIKEGDLVTSSLDEVEMKKSRSHKRVYELFRKAGDSLSSHQISNSELDLHFVFCRKPESFLPSIDQRKVAGVCLEKTCLKGDDATGRQYAVGTGEFETIKCGLVLKSIGYKSLLVDELPFDQSKGIVPNSKGRVLLPSKLDNTVYVNGVYVVGWLKRGPTGIIGTNLFCAEETVESITEDIRAGLLGGCHSSHPGRVGLLEALQTKGVQYVSFNEWKKIDAKEKELGSVKGKPREKITSWEELLKVAIE